jgi:uncharacterized protein (TIGR03435 family)
MLRTILFLSIATIAWSQPGFDAASVRVSAPDKSTEGAWRGIRFAPGSLTIRDTTLSGILMAAYDLQFHQLAAPDWAGRERYDITARAAGAAGEPELRQMLRQLLADRFHVLLHREQKDIPAFVLLPGKKSSRLSECKDAGPGVMRGKGGEMIFEHYSMAELAAFLAKLPGDRRPVLDQTGLTGRFDFSIEIVDSNPDNLLETKRAAERTLTDPGFPAMLASQLGLKLEARTAPSEILVIDRIERPAEN